MEAVASAPVLRGVISCTVCCVTAFVAAGCGGHDECALEEGKAYRLELVDRYDATSSFVLRDAFPADKTCGSLDALAEGMQLGFQVLQPEPECELFILLDDEPGDFQSFAAQRTAVSNVSGTYEATTSSGCFGVWTLIFQMNSLEDAFKVPVPGTIPPLKVLRSFRGLSGTCSTQELSCGDQFVAQVHRL